MARTTPLKRRILSAYRNARIVAETQGHSLARQAAEIARVKRLNPTLGVSDYYWYRLYDPGFTASARIHDYLGWRVEDDLSQALNPRNLMMPAWDKFTFDLFAKAYGLPVPRLHALFKPGPRLAIDSSVDALTSPDALTEWLRSRREWPVFAKPSCSRRSLGCYHFVGYDAADDTLHTSRDVAIPVTRFVSEICDDSERPFYKAAMGYLFQEVLRPHAAIAEILGSDAISGVRVVVLQDRHGVEIVSAMWKMASGDNELDVFYAVTPAHFGQRGSGKRPGRECRRRLVATRKLVDAFAATGRTLEISCCPMAEVLVQCRRAQPSFR